uniref:tRNA dimethylallyltransferase n=1 Tax=Lygus hesperus TaxID=30085 RepID=A0A0A9YY79_LYGHE
MFLSVPQLCWMMVILMLNSFGSGFHSEWVEYDDDTTSSKPAMKLDDQKSQKHSVFDYSNEDEFTMVDKSDANEYYTLIEDAGWQNVVTPERWSRKSERSGISRRSRNNCM